MEEMIYKCLETLNVVQFFGIAVLFYLFYKFLDKRFESIDKRFDKIETQIESLKTEVNQLDKRVFAIETMMRMKECCMIKDERQTRKAE